MTLRTNKYQIELHLLLIVYFIITWDSIAPLIIKRAQSILYLFSDKNQTVFVYTLQPNSMCRLLLGESGSISGNNFKESGIMIWIFVGFDENRCERFRSSLRPCSTSTRPVRNQKLCTTLIPRKRRDNDT